MPSWGTNTASPGGLFPHWPAAYLAVALGCNSARYHLGRACLNLDSRAILSNIVFTPEEQAPLPVPGRQHYGGIKDEYPRRESGESSAPWESENTRLSRRVLLVVLGLVVVAEVAWWYWG